MRFLNVAVAAAALLGRGASSAAVDEKGAASCAEVPYLRSYFYVGGGYVDDGAGGHVFRDQMYVERLRPADGVTQKTPLVLIHGQAQTGTVSTSVHGGLIPRAYSSCDVVRRQHYPFLARSAPYPLFVSRQQPLTRAFRIETGGR